jgi:hypothetical protein
MKSLIIFAASCSILLFTACNKEPGEGGTSSVTGKLVVYDVNGSGDTTSAQYPAMDADVFIIYGTETETYSDNFKTSFDGSYRFDYLTPGTYTIFAYSECSTCAGGQEVRSTTIEITDKKQAIALDDLTILN